MSRRTTHRREQGDNQHDVWNRSHTSFRLTVLLGQRACTASCTADFSNRGLYHKFMKADLRISIKEYHRNKNLKTRLWVEDSVPLSLAARPLAHRRPG